MILEKKKSENLADSVILNLIKYENPQPLLSCSLPKKIVPLLFAITVLYELQLIFALLYISYLPDWQKNYNNIEFYTVILAKCLSFVKTMCM